MSIDGAGSRPTNTLPLTYAGLLGVFENRSLVSTETIHFGGGLLYTIGAKLARMSEGKLMGLAPYIDNKNIKLSGLNQAVDFLENQFFSQESIIKVLEGLSKV